MSIVALIFTAIFLILLDIIWFSWSVPRIYNPTFTAIQGNEISLNVAGGVVTWLLLAAGIAYFNGTYPNQEKTKLTVMRDGAVLGFIIYGVYNGTNYATLDNYNLKTAIADTLWGTFVISMGSLFHSFIV